MKKLGKLPVAAFAVAAATVWASAGTLDNSFANAGWLNQPTLTAGASSARAVLAQSSGKYVVTGTTTVSGQSTDFIATRFDANGSIDPSFGNGGSININFFSGADTLRDGVIQADGKIVMTGECVDGAGALHFCATRITANGALDTTFGTSGKMSVPVNANAAHLAASIDSAGRIVVVGQDGTVIIRRLLTNGAPDTSFGTNGVVSLSSESSIQFAITTDANDNIYTTGIGRNAPIVVNKITSTGNLDTSFGIGSVVRDADHDLRMPQAIAIQPDGKILIGAYKRFTAPTTQYDAAVVRYLADGSRDGTFGVSGIALFDEDYRDDIRELGLLSDGSIIIGSSARNAADDHVRMVIAKMSSIGTLIYKHVHQMTDSKVDYLRGMHVFSDGSVIANANSGHIGNNRFGQLRLNAAGVPDISFGNNGQNAHSPSLAKATNWIGAIVQADGKQLHLGQVDRSTAIVVRLLASGEIDPSFGSGGSFTFSHSSSNQIPNDEPTVQFAMTTTGKLVLARRSFKYNGDLTSLIMLDSEGRLDNSFGNGGELTIASAPNLETIDRIVVRNDGKILLIGGKYRSPFFTTIHQLNADGSADASFGSNGTLEYSAVQLTKVAGASLDAQGRLVLVINEGNAAFVSRVTVNGQWDSTFGVTNNVTQLAKANRFTATGLHINSNGSLFITGETEDTRIDAAIFALTNIGYFDTAFDSDGYQVLVAGGSQSRAVAVVPVSGNQLMVSGWATDNHSEDDFFLTRLSSSGQLDTTFGNGGFSRVGLPSSSDRLSTSTYVGPGRLLLSGNCKAVACGAMVFIESAKLEVSTTAHDFGQLTVNTTSAPVAITIRNTGATALNIASISVSGPFQQTNTCPASMAPSTQCEVRLVFAPTSTGTFNSTLALSTNAGSQAISLSGSAAAAPPPPTTPPPAESGSSGGGGSMGMLLSLLMLMYAGTRKKRGTR